MPLCFRDPVLSLQQPTLLLWCQFDSWPGNFHMLQVQPKKQKPKNKLLSITTGVWGQKATWGLEDLWLSFSDIGFDCDTLDDLNSPFYLQISDGNGPRSSFPGHSWNEPHPCQRPADHLVGWLCQVSARLLLTVQTRRLRTRPALTLGLCLSGEQLVDFSTKKFLKYSNRSSCYINLSPNRTFCYKKIEGYFREPKGLESDWSQKQGSCQNCLLGAAGQRGTVASCVCDKHPPLLI